MDRIVRRIESTPLNVQQDEVRPFSAYADKANIVLLGDSGAGKTHTFREAAKCSGGCYITARAFLVTPATNLKDVLFIDGLDEKRAGRSDRDTVDDLVKKLFAVGARKVRISCRVGDWLGATDLAALRPYFDQSEEPVVLHLTRLSADEQREVLCAVGLNVDAANTFLDEAKERSLDDLLDNPQNLIMLLDAVRQMGTWPTTRRELFELSTELMLQESDKHRARSGIGVFTPEELRPVAGAACAARLISDVEAISLSEHESSAAVPSYRSISMITPERTLATLCRRVFVAGTVPESVDYAHRTTAEYLGARWLADAVRNGMPLGRLLALMGVDGHPAPELRGLHAWLAVHLPEHADRLIDSDPYGVLTYGDAASLSQSSCKHLIEALALLSQTDPWFRSGDRGSPAISGLARVDMVDEFRAVLRSNDVGFGVRSIVVEAAARGMPMPALKDDLANVVLRAQSPYVERLHALDALLRITPDGEAAALAAFHKLGADASALRLRVEVIRWMYRKRQTSLDVMALLKDVAAGSENESYTGILFDLSEDMPLEDIPTVLDDLSEANIETHGGRRNKFELARFIDRVLIRGLRELTDVDPPRALRWLWLRHSHSQDRGSGESNHLRDALLARKDLLTAVTDHFLDKLSSGDERWRQLYHFQRATLSALTAEDLFLLLKTHLARAPVGSEKEVFFYQAALRTTFALDEWEINARFEELFALGETRDDLREARDVLLWCEKPSIHFDRPSRENTRNSPEELRGKFENEAESIRSGSHLGWLTWAAKIYLGLFHDSDRSATPHDRVVAVLGETNMEMSISGFIAALSRPDLPTLSAVIDLSLKHRHYEWWNVLRAGLIERENARTFAEGLGDDFLKAMLVFDLTNPRFEEVGSTSRIIVSKWKAALMQDRPELVRDAYLAIARAKFADRAPVVDGLDELMREEAFEPYRGTIALRLLQDFPNAAKSQLDQLINCISCLPGTQSEFCTIAERILADEKPIGQQAHDKWLAAAYVLSPTRYERLVDATAKQRPGLVFDLRDCSGHRSHGNQPLTTLALSQLEFLARLTGTHFSDISFPATGWHGDTNDWDAAEYCRRLVTEISAIPSQAASEALRRLESDPAMTSYNPYLRHAVANQEKRRREVEYDRPDWRSTIKALSNGAPATAADLHALLLDQIDDVRMRISHENTDIYKQFWNLDSYSRPTMPRPEEACRDALVTLLRPMLRSKDVMIEPEGHMVADKRADISAAIPGRKILFELKRDYHSELWTAADQQLERYYAHDPEAKGYGIYGIFWFGTLRGTAMPKHPEGCELPKSPKQLAQMLRDRIPVDRRNRLAVVVIDVSGPLT